MWTYVPEQLSRRTFQPFRKEAPRNGSTYCFYSYYPFYDVHTIRYGQRGNDRQSVLNTAFFATWGCVSTGATARQMAPIDGHVLYCALRRTLAGHQTCRSTIATRSDGTLFDDITITG